MRIVITGGTGFLGSHLRAALERDGHEAVVVSRKPDAADKARVGWEELSRAVEFWPLVGDVASQERRSARVVDSSTLRTEVLVRVPAGAEPGVVGAGEDGDAHFEIPLHAISSERGVNTFVAALRHRVFVPSPGFHPDLRALDPLVVTWRRGGLVSVIHLHGWKPGGGAYAGLPANEDEAAARREERVRIATPPASEPRSTRSDQERSTSSPRPRPLESAARPLGLTVDLRRAFASR